MDYENIKYIIVPIDEIDSIDFDCVKQSAPEDITDLEQIQLKLRVSNDATIDTGFFILKYEGNKPRCLYGKTVYTHTQLLSIINDQDGIWFNNSDY